MKSHILHDFRTSTPFEGNSSDHFTDHFTDLDKLKPLTNFDVNMKLFLGGVTNYVLHV